MKLAQMLLKLVHQVPKNLSLLATGEHEVHVFENSHCSHNSRGPRVSHRWFTRF